MTDQPSLYEYVATVTVTVTVPLGTSAEPPPGEELEKLRTQVADHNLSFLRCTAVVAAIRADGRRLS